MPEWRDQAIVLSARSFGEDAAVVTVLTESHGRHAGLVRGGQSRRIRPILQPGNKVVAVWRARLYDQLGTMQVELLDAHAAHCLTDPLKLASIAAMASLIQTATAEREPLPRVYDATTAYLTHLSDPAVTDPLLWLSAYIRWEVGILAAVGFGLALDACAVTGATDHLAYVSPRTGAAVTKAAAGKHIAKLLPLPSFLGPSFLQPDFLGDTQTQQPLTQKHLNQELLAQEVVDGMRLTAHFIDREIFQGHKASLASPRHRLHAMVETRYSKDTKHTTDHTSTHTIPAGV